MIGTAAETMCLNAILCWRGSSVSVEFYLLLVSFLSVENGTPSSDLYTFTATDHSRQQWKIIPTEWNTHN